jgi:hypothetical protein
VEVAEGIDEHRSTDSLGTEVDRRCWQHHREHGFAVRAANVDGVSTPGLDDPRRRREVAGVIRPTTDRREVALRRIQRARRQHSQKWRTQREEQPHQQPQQRHERPTAQPPTQSQVFNPSLLVLT